MKEGYDISETINVGFEVQIHRDKDGSISHCYVPEIEQYFSTKNQDEIERKTSAFVKMYISFWDEYNNNGEKKDFSSMKK